MSAINVIDQPENPLHRAPLVENGLSFSEVTDLVAAPAEAKTPRAWYIGFGISLCVVANLFAMIGWLILNGVGVWGNNVPVGWGWPIVNFVFWIGIGHAGTLISAILFLFRQKWRTSINRSAEAMTLFAVACALIFPGIHVGRVWVAYWMFPVPNQMAMWPQFKSPLLWDVFAVSTYFTVSLIFWFLGMVPDLATIRDRSGDVQLFISKAVVGDDAFEQVKSLDLGDWVGVHGTVMTTRKGELSVKAETVQLLAKAVRPLPDKWHGLTDTDTRFRQRYADLMMNDEARRTFEIRHEVVASFRRTLRTHGYIEVETPVLHVEAGGALARPFVTHHNTLDLDLYLRIALELHLKRLIVGGFDKVYEIGRIFRNEGISTKHNPEFTMLEFYQAYADYEDGMALGEDLLRKIKAAQYVAAHPGEVCPAKWKEGEETLAPSLDLVGKI